MQKSILLGGDFMEKKPTQPSKGYEKAVIRPSSSAGWAQSSADKPSMTSRPQRPVRPKK